VHEVLEAVWKTVAGDLRQALQGLIQIAVAFHHHAHGNLRGARSLLVEGRARLAAVPPGTLAANTDALLAATAPMEAAFRDGTTAVIPPRLELRQ
jgi:predicted metal-dependent hydrolase